AVAFHHRLPIGRGCASKRIDTDLHTRRADGFQIDDVCKVFHVGSDKVLGVRRRNLEGSTETDALDAFVTAAQQLVRAVLNPVGDVGVGRASVRWIVFETAVGWRVVRRGDNDAVRKSFRATPVVSKDGVRNDRSRREAVVALNKCFYPVSGQNLQCDSLRGSGKRVRVFAHKQRASYSLAAPVFADGLSNGKDMRLGNESIRAGAQLPACAELDELICG